MDILNMLGLGQSQATQAAGQLGVAPSQMSAALEAAVPLLLGQLGQNASNPQGAQALSSALGQHDGSALDTFARGSLPNLAEGQNIVGHVFGNQQNAAASAVAQRAGINPQVAMQILAMVAPLVMAYLGRNQGGAAGGGLGGVLGGNLGGLGSILGSVLGGAGGGLGSVLGGILGGGQPSAEGNQQAQVSAPQPSAYGQGNYGQASESGVGGVGLEPLNPPTSSAGQPQQGGGLFGTLSDVLGGNHGALDDLIGMFGTKR